MEDHRPWADLPYPLLDQILDRLPLPYYIRFSAVCPRWRSVQIDHRRHSRLLSYPWLIPSDLKQEEDDPQKNQRINEEDAVIVPCYSPFERHIYHLPNLPISSPSHFCCASSSHGWILLQQLNYPKDVDPSDIEIIGRSRKSRKTMRKQIQMRRNWPPPLPKNILSFYFLNPILNLRISLPPIRLGFFSGYQAAISDSSHCTALVLTGFRELFLFRDGDHDWIPLPFIALSIFQAVSCGGKFYCLCSCSSILVIDPCCHATPSIEHFEMDASQMRATSSWGILLESGGHLLLVKAVFNSRDEFEIEGFRVFKADLSNKMWEPMECLGDRMLLLDCHSSVSLVADGIGGRRNCIYFSEGSIGNPFSSNDDAEWSAWKVFDMGSESITDWPLPNMLSEGDCLKIKKNARRWIVPSIVRI